MHKHHDHEHLTTGKRLVITMFLNFSITIAEIIGGIVSGSLSLISDALHNFSDGISVIISYFALKLKEREYSPSHTFGMKRAEIFAAVINAAVLIGISVYLFYEAVMRFIHPTPIAGKTMTLVAAIGLVANVAGVLLLKRDSKNSTNIRSAYLHLFADALSSVGVILGGIFIMVWDVYWVDPLLTILIGLYILKGSYEIMAESVHVLMEGAPPGISIDEIRREVERQPDVQDIHHIHMWMVGENDVHLEGHVNVQDMLISRSDALRERIENVLKEKFNIAHITLQFECGQCINENLPDQEDCPGG
ncbi:MAG: cation diffusion facilitator family transporter [Calditrichia bacterium]